MTEEQNIANDPSNVADKPRKKTMSEAALAANRANAKKSAGPRTAAGKARSASNAFQHGLYSMKNYSHLVTYPNLVAITVHNLLEEYQPVTPTDPEITQNFTDYIYKEFCRRMELSDDERAAQYPPMDDLR